MIYTLIELHNGNGYVLAPQCRIANSDDYIASILLGIDLNSKFGPRKAKWVSYKKQELLNLHFRFFGEVCVVYMFNF